MGVLFLEEENQKAVKLSPKAKQQKRSTGPSRVVPHRSTTPARTSLTSLFGWEAVSLVDMAALIRLAVHKVHKVMMWSQPSVANNADRTAALEAKRAQTVAAE